MRLELGFERTGLRLECERMGLGPEFEGLGLGPETTDVTTALPLPRPGCFLPEPFDTSMYGFVLLRSMVYSFAFHG